jgi:hypothetical protein
MVSVRAGGGQCRSCDSGVNPSDSGQWPTRVIHSDSAGTKAVGAEVVRRIGGVVDLGQWKRPVRAAAIRPRQNRSGGAASA